MTRSPGRRWIGRWLLVVGIVQALLGAGTYIDPVVAIVREKLWNTVDAVPGRPLAFWLIFAGLLLALLGALAHWIEAREPLPRFLGWTLLVFAVLGIVLMPISGFWFLLPPAAGILARRGQRPSPGPIAGLDHVQLAMPPGGEEAARGFYTGLLGLSEVAKPAPLAARGGCWFEGTDTILHLGIENDFAPAKKAHPALLVTDLEGCRARLAAADVAITPDDALPGVRRFYAADPFGNRVELIQGEDGFSRQSSMQ